NVRLGIAGGLVVVGDLIGAGAAQEHGVVGETPNLAARLQALARPGTLVVADSTRRQIGTLFEIEDLGASAARRFCGSATRLACGWRKRRPQPFRGIALGGDAARRPRRGARTVGAALAASDYRRGSGGTVER